MYLFGVHLAGVLFSVVAAFASGAAWYSALFAKPYERFRGSHDQEPLPAGAAYGSIFAINVVTAFAYALIVPAAASVGASLLTGVAVGTAFVFLSLGINYLGAGRPTTLWMIDGSFHIVRFAWMGLFFGFFPPS